MKAPWYLLLLVVLMTASVGAVVPVTISYQGRVSSNTESWVDTAVTMHFEFCADSLGGSSLWSETQADVPIKAGLFTVLLGSVTPIPPSVFDGADRWLRIQVGDLTMNPMTRVLSTPYSYHALHADSAFRAASVTDNAITTAQIANSTILFGDINQNSAASGNVMKWNGSSWTAAPDETGTSTAGGWNDNGTFVRLSNAGDSVGIGTNTPTAKLQVMGDLRVTSGDVIVPGTGAVKFGNDTTKLESNLTDLSIGAKGDIALQPAENLFVGYATGVSWAKFEGSSMRVGIGTLSIDDKLHVENSSSGGTAFLRLQSSHASSFGEAGLRIQSPENTWHLRMDDYSHNNLPELGSLALRSGDAGAEVMTWLEDRRVGIGTTSPEERLHVVNSAFEGNSYVKMEASHATGFGQAGLWFTTPQNDWLLRMDNHNNGFSPSGSLSLLSEGGGVEAMTWLRTGLVGIGTSTPTSKLHVFGNARIRDTIFAGAYGPGTIKSVALADGPGIAGNTNNFEVTTSTSWTVVDSVTIDAPGPGYVLAIASGSFYADHPWGDFLNCFYTISTSRTSSSGSRTYFNKLDRYIDGGEYTFMATIHELFSVTASGPHTYYFLAHNVDLTVDELECPFTTYQHAVSALFVPTAHGTVQVSGQSDSPEIERVSGLTQPPTSTITSSDTQSQVKELQDQVKILMSEVAALKAIGVKK